MSPVSKSPPLWPLPPSATVKVGGSLLGLADLVDRLDQLRPCWGARPLIIVGGGPAGDLVRDWDQQHQLGEERSHWLALDALHLTSQLLTARWPVACVASLSEIETLWKQGRVPVLRAREWLESAEQVGEPTPPQTWESTTDTIAAWIAATTYSESLWLLKSVVSPDTLAEATQRELVDPQFEKWVPVDTPLHWVNLRDMTHTQFHSHEKW